MISDKAVDILVQSRDASYRAAFTAVVTHSITDYLPHFNINATSWMIPQNISLPDPHFNQSQRIDILLGAELFVVDRALPTLQNTKLGWIVHGGLSSNMPTHKSVLQASIKDPADHFDESDFGKLRTSLRLNHLYCRKTCDVSNLSLKIAQDLETANTLFASCPLRFEFSR